MDYKQRDHVTKFLKLQAEALAELEALFTSVDADTIASHEFSKMEHDLVNLQNRFSRLVYLSGEVTGE